MTSYLKKNLYTPMRYNCHWETRDELDFLSRLGRNDLTSTHSAPRRVLLTRYLDAALQRSNWGLMDKAKCIATAHAMMTENA